MAIYSISGKQNKPIVNYTVSINGQAIELGSTSVVSFQPPFNKIDITLTSTNCSLDLCRGTVVEDGNDTDTPIELYHEINIAANTPKTLSFNINSTNFIHGNTVYRINLYARNTDGIWDVTQVLFTIDGKIFVPSNYDGVEVLVDSSVLN